MSLVKRVVNLLAALIPLEISYQIIALTQTKNIVAGMIASGVLWGYLSDTLGRKKLMIVGTFFTSMFLILSGFSQSYEMLLSFKFMGGFM